MSFHDYVKREMELFMEHEPPRGMLAEWCERSFIGIKAAIGFLSLAQFVTDGTLMTKKEATQLERQMVGMRKNGLFKGEEDGSRSS